jgi:hypothetical protein
MDIDKDEISEVAKPYSETLTKFHGLFSESPKSWILQSKAAFDLSVQNIQNEDEAKQLMPPWFAATPTLKPDGWNALESTERYLAYLRLVAREDVPASRKAEEHQEFSKFLQAHPIDNITELYLLSYNVANYLEYEASKKRGAIKNNEVKMFKEWAIRYFLTKKTDNPKKCTKSWASIQIKKLLERDYPESKIPSIKTIKEIWLSGI